jgi:tRNA pseudouridine32 synthase/23S rRNA pseudouridine746 synthase
MEDVLVADVVVRYQDHDLMIVEKPTMLASVPGKSQPDSLITRLKRHWPYAKIVHRLDVETSGLMVVALTSSCHAALSRMFRHRDVSKGYLAMVAGIPSQGSGRIEAPLICDWPNRPLQKVDWENGKPSSTRWRTLQARENSALLYLRPKTGRSHQLRVHLKSVGHPILGDTFYAPEAVQAQASRLLLHACLLRFIHPMTNQLLRFTSLVSFDPFVR